MDLLIYIIQYILLFWILCNILAWVGIMLILNFSGQYRNYYGYTEIILVTPSLKEVICGPLEMLSIFNLAIELSLPNDEDIEEY